LILAQLKSKAFVIFFTFKCEKYNKLTAVAKQPFGTLLPTPLLKLIKKALAFFISKGPLLAS